MPELPTNQSLRPRGFPNGPNTWRFEGAGRFDQVALGTACVVEQLDRKVSEQRLDSSQIPEAIACLQAAFSAVAQRYEKMTSATPQTAVAAEGNFNALSIARSNHTLRQVEERLVSGRWSANYAVDRYFRELAEGISSFPDAQREVHQLRLDLLEAIEPSGQSSMQYLLDRIAATPGDIILVAESMSPQELLQLQESRVVGVILRSIGAISHVAVAFPHILPGRPLISSVDPIAFSRIKHGDTVIVDGRTGFVTVNPGEQEVRVTQTSILALGKGVTPISLSTHAPKTSDGLSLRFTADIFGAADAQLVRTMEYGGVGLYRTEIPIIAGHKWLSEHEWFEHFVELLGAIAPRPIVVRIPDFNDVDKHVPGLDAHRAEGSGLSGIRLMLNIFRPQLVDMVRGLARASIEKGNRVSLLMPMVLDLHDVRETKRLVTTELRKLKTRGGDPPHPSLLSLAAMIETSSAFRLVRRILSRVDSINIGTNDTLKATLSGDRNKSTSAFYHPGFLKEMRGCIHTARLLGKTVRICGEMPNHPQYIPLLVGVGAEDLVVAPHAVEKVNAMVSGCHTVECTKLANLIIRSADERVALRIHEAYIRKNGLP